MLDAPRPKIVKEIPASARTQGWVDEHIEASNAEKMPDFPQSIVPFTLMLQDQMTGEYLGGMYGQLWMHALYIKRLFILTDFRKQGFGRKMVKSAESLAIRYGCHLATLESLSFQSSLGFYLKLGYHVAWEDDNYMNDIRIYHLRKKISLGCD